MPSENVHNHITNKNNDETESFWGAHGQDLTDADYHLFASPGRKISLQIREGRITLAVQDFGDICRSVNGKDEYEFWYSLDNENTHRFLEQLRLKHCPEDDDLDAILKNEFGCDSGSVRFKEFCDEINVNCRFFSY